jgi:hypothetical protein
MNEAVSLDYDRRPSAVPYMVRGMMPVTRRVNLAPQMRARWVKHRAPTRACRIQQDRRPPTAGATLPLLYPHTFGFRLAMAILTHPKFPVPIWGVLQTRNHLVQHRFIAVDESLDFETRVMHARVVPKGAEFDLRTTVHAAGALAWESIVTFFTRGRFGEPEPASPLTRSPSEFGPLAAEWIMRNADHWKFGSFTGDYNGIHMWDWYARRLGFRRALYHPPRVLGECLARLPGPTSMEDADGRLRLDAWLKGPVSHGANVRMHATTTATTSTFALAGDERPQHRRPVGGVEVGSVGSVRCRIAQCDTGPKAAASATEPQDGCLRRRLHES